MITIDTLENSFDQHVEAKSSFQHSTVTFVSGEELVQNLPTATDTHVIRATNCQTKGYGTYLVFDRIILTMTLSNL